MKRIIIGFLVVVVLLVAAALVAPGFVDWNKYKGQIVSQINNASGYEVQIDGNLELAIIPFPRLMIEKVSVASPAARNEEPFVTLERVDVSVALGPLLSKEIDVTRIRLLRPSLNLVVAGDGTPSWLVQERARPDEAASAPDGQSGNNVLDSVSLDEIVIDKGSLTYRDDTKGQSFALDHIEMTVNAQTLYGPFVIDGSASYEGHNISTDIKTERVVKGAKSFPVNLSVSIPATGSVLRYAGVVDFEDGLELQGDTGLETDDLAGLAAVSGVSLPPSLARPFSVHGLFTMSPDALSSKNMNLSFADMSAAGRFEIGSLADKSKPVNMDVALTSPALDLDAFMPAGGKKTNAGTARANDDGFLPETVTLPRALSGRMEIKADKLTYRGTSFDSVNLSGNMSGNTAAWDFSAAAPSESAITLNGSAAFASASLSQSTGAMTYSDPVVKTAIDIKTNNALSLYNMSGPLVDVPESYKPLLDRKAMTLDADVTVTATEIRTGDESRLRMDGDMAVFGAGFAKGRGGGRDRLTLKASASNIDIDRWLEKLPKEKNAKDAKDAKASPFETAQKLDLPFDLSLDLTLPGISVQGKKLESFSAKADKTGSKLSVEQISLQDESGNNLRLGGAVADMEGLNGIDMLISGSTADAGPVLEFAGLDTAALPAIGSAELLAEFKGHADDLAFTANVKALRGTAEATGALTGLTGAPVLGDLSFRLKHPNYVQLVNLFKPDFKSAVALNKNLDIFASVKQDGGVYNLSDINAMIGPTAIAGTLIADMSGTRPKLTGQLQFGDVPLGDLLGHEKQAGTRQGQQAQGGQNVRWSRDPIDATALHLFDADMQISAKSFTYGTWTVSGLALDALLENGQLTLRKMDGNLYGGRVSMTGDIKAPDTAGKPLAIKGKVDSRDVDLESFVRSFSGRRLIQANGTMFLDTEIAMTGASPAALIFDMNGKGGADGVNLVIQGFDLARLSRTLAQPSSSMSENLGSLLNSTMSSGSTEFETLHSRYTIKNGVITFDTLELKGPEAVVTGTGNVNLPVWSVNLETVVDLTEPEDAPPLRTAFKGPLDNPVSTFGKSALDSWFQSQFGDMIEKSIINKLQEQGIIRSRPLEQPAPQTQQEQQPATNGSSTDGAVTDQGTPPESPSAEQPAPASGEKQKKPEEMFFNILQDVLQ